MGCACKVNQQINLIKKEYGINSNKQQMNVVDTILLFIRKFLFLILLLPFYPIIFFYILGRSLFTKSPLKLDNFIKKSKKDVRNT